MAKASKRYCVADYWTKDGRSGWVGFHSSAQTWKGLCRAARKAIWENSLFNLGETVTDGDIARLIVNGNAE